MAFRFDISDETGTYQWIMEKTDLKQFHKLFDEVDPDSARITILTGAGISAESGIPTFK